MHVLAMGAGFGQVHVQGICLYEGQAGCTVHVCVRDICVQRVGQGMCMQWLQCPCICEE